MYSQRQAGGIVKLPSEQRHIFQQGSCACPLCVVPRPQGTLGNCKLSGAIYKTFSELAQLPTTVPQKEKIQSVHFHLFQGGHGGPEELAPATLHPLAPQRLAWLDSSLPRVHSQIGAS
jgi:hypothetical protein